jgi:hypothetical protein
MTLKNARNGGHNQAHMATLNGLDQAGRMDQSGHSPGSSNNLGSGHKDDKFKGRKCVCDDVHLFKECLYIVTSARKPGWKENPTVREEARQRIMKNVRFMTIIKHIININILDGLNDQKDQKEGTAEDDDHFSFSDVAIKPQNVVMLEKNPPSNSVIYDSGCNQQLTYDKARFIGQIIPASE